MRLLQILAFCSPGPISMTLLYGDEMNKILLPFDEALREKRVLGQVIGDISRLALVRSTRLATACRSTGSCRLSSGPR